MSIIECGDFLYVFYDVCNSKFRFKKYKLDAIVNEEEFNLNNNILQSIYFYYYKFRPDKCFSYKHDKSSCIQSYSSNTTE